MVTLDTFLYRRLLERLEEENRIRAEFLMNGSAQNYEEYKQHVGYLKGISDALIWAKEINDELIGKSQNAR